MTIIFIGTGLANKVFTMYGSDKTGETSLVSSTLGSYAFGPAISAGSKQAWRRLALAPGCAQVIRRLAALGKCSVGAYFNRAANFSTALRTLGATTAMQ